MLDPTARPLNRLSELLAHLSYGLLVRSSMLELFNKEDRCLELRSGASKEEDAADFMGVLEK